MLRLSLGLVVLTSFISLGCQTSMLKQFNQVKSGMDKHDVIEIMGSPNRTERFHGKDRWTYVFYDEKLKHEKEVQFFEGTAIYVGDIWEPTEEKSAVVVDKKNAEDDQKIQEQLAKEESVLKAARQEFNSSELENSSAAAKVKYVPQFQGVD